MRKKKGEDQKAIISPKGYKLRLFNVERKRGTKMREVKQVYVADDGSEWDHEFEAKFRDEEVAHEAEVRKWMEEVGMKPSTATRAKKAIMEFFRWSRQYVKED